MSASMNTGIHPTMAYISGSSYVSVTFPSPRTCIGRLKKNTMSKLWPPDSI